MENEKIPLPEDDSWLDDFLAPSDSSEELSPDDQAMDSHGMDYISDMELEKIIQEALSEDWDLDDLSQDPDAPPVVEGDFGDELDENFQPGADFPDEPFGYDEEEFDPEDPLPEEDAEAEEYPQEPEIPAEEDPDAPVRKVRPKRKEGYGLLAIPHLISVAIWAAIALMVGVTFGRLLWVCASDVLAFGREEEIITITITESDTIATITDKLYNAGLIKYKDLFTLYADLTDAQEDITPGTYELSTLYDYHALVGSMHTVALRSVTEVTIPEGYSCAQIFALLDEKGVCNATELEEYAATGTFESYWFLEGTPRGDKYCLEGFLFPDTYEFYLDSTPKEVFIKLLGRFNEKYSEQLRSYLVSLNEMLSEKMRKQGYHESYIEENQMTLYDVIIVASMVEKETAHTGEGYAVASVIYNRLCNPGFLFLNIDATLVYALGGKPILTEEDKLLDTPYNTYKYPGLTPGPISNPGLASIQAALCPEETNYYYYALNPSTGEHHFSKTYQEHLEFLESLGK